jgi:glycopeptide antibiotics resistance protein
MTLDYKSPAPPTTTNHDHVYTTLLGVLGSFLIIGMVTLASMRQRPGITSEARAAFLNALMIEGCFFAAIALGLLIRLVFPAYRRWPTLGLNIVLVLFVPLGTALAIYGFWKVDKNLPRDSN